MRNPEVVVGARAPEATGRTVVREMDTDAERRAQLPTAVPFLPPDTVEFHSDYGQGRFQLANPKLLRDPDTGATEVVSEGLVAQFEKGRLITGDLEIIHRLKGCQGCELHRKGCRPHPQYGIGKHIWDAQEMAARAKEKAIAEAVETFKSNPEAVAGLLKELGVKDWDVKKKE